MNEAIKRCDANHCNERVSASRGLCTHHWRMLPEAAQARIYEVARKYKSRAQRLASVDFLEAWADAVELIARTEGRLTRNAFRSLAEMLKSRALAKGAE